MVLVVALAGFVITGGVRTSRARRARQEAALLRDATPAAEGRAMGVVHRAVGEVSQRASPAELRRRVSNMSGGTYIDDILAEQDSTLYRWPERLSNAIRVYIEPDSDIPGWDPQLPQIAQGVFSEWSAAGFPLSFVFVYDTVGADITIRWRERFPPADGQRIGVTERIQTSAYLIDRATLLIANHDSTGRTLSTRLVGGIVRHEVGHALGLNHANDPTSVMYYEAATATISTSDRATLRLLYLIPSGTLKD